MKTKTYPCQPLCPWTSGPHDDKDQFRTNNGTGTRWLGVPPDLYTRRRYTGTYFTSPQYTGSPQPRWGPESSRPSESLLRCLKRHYQWEKRGLRLYCRSDDPKTDPCHPEAHQFCLSSLPSRSPLSLTRRRLYLLLCDDRCPRQHPSTTLLWSFSGYRKSANDSSGLGSGSKSSRLLLLRPESGFRTYLPHKKSCFRYYRLPSYKGVSSDNNNRLRLKSSSHNIHRSFKNSLPHEHTWDAELRLLDSTRRFLRTGTQNWDECLTVNR